MMITIHKVATERYFSSQYMDKTRLAGQGHHNGKTWSIRNTWKFVANNSGIKSEIFLATCFTE